MKANSCFATKRDEFKNCYYAARIIADQDSKLTVELLCANPFSLRIEEIVGTESLIHSDYTPIALSTFDLIKEEILKAQSELNETINNAPSLLSQPLAAGACYKTKNSILYVVGLLKDCTDKYVLEEYKLDSDHSSLKISIIFLDYSSIENNTDLVAIDEKVFNLIKERTNKVYLRIQSLMP